MKPHLRRLLEKDEDTPSITGSASTTSSPNPVPFNKNISGIDSSMASTILVILIAVFFMGLFSVYLHRFYDESPIEISQRRRRRRRTHTPSSSFARISSSSSSSSSSHGVPLSVIKSLPLFAYTKMEKQQLDCVVCLSEFEERGTVKMIPYCGHVFHPGCIDTWFSSHASCPLCRSTQLLQLHHPRPNTEEEKKESSTVINERPISTVEDGGMLAEGDRAVGRMRRSSSWGTGNGSGRNGEIAVIQRTFSL